MNDHGSKPVLWTTILFRAAMLLVLLAALAVAFAPNLANLFSPQRRMTTSGDPADIRLVGVVPDGDDVLLDARGKVIPGVKFEWPGKRTYTWLHGRMLREFLFEVGPGVSDLELNKDNPGSILLREGNSWSRDVWIPNASFVQADEPLVLPDGRQRILLRVAMSQTYSRHGVIFGKVDQPPIEEINV